MDTPDPITQLALIATGRCRARSVEIQNLSRLVSEAWLAKSAVVAAEHDQRKAAAMMLAVLTLRDVELLTKVFHRAMLEVETLRRYMVYLRSCGRCSLGTRPKKLIREWLNAQPAWKLRAEAFGKHRPTLADIVRWTHPKPIDEAHSVVYAWMSGRPTSVVDLPDVPSCVPKEASDTEDESSPIESEERPSEVRIRRRNRSISVVEGVDL